MNLKHKEAKAKVMKDGRKFWKLWRSPRQFIDFIDRKVEYALERLAGCRDWRFAKVKAFLGERGVER